MGSVSCHWFWAPYLSLQEAPLSPEVFAEKAALFTSWLTTPQFFLSHTERAQGAEGMGNQ